MVVQLLCSFGLFDLSQGILILHSFAMPISCNTACNVDMRCCLQHPPPKLLGGTLSPKEI